MTASDRGDGMENEAEADGAGSDDAATGADAISADPGLIFDKLDAWLDGFFRLLPNIGVALALLLVFVALGLGAGWAIRRSARGRDRGDLGQVVGSLTKWGIILAGALLALTIVVPSIRPGDLIAGLGIGSVAIGFAFKDILQNLLAGLLILIRRPFRVGDQIISGSYEGTVEHIETRATLIRTYDGRRAVIPNSDVFTRAVLVNTAFDARRSEYDFPIPLDADWDRAVEVARDAAQGVAGLADAGAEALAVSVGDLAKAVRVRWWTDPTQKEVVHVSSAVLLAVERALIDAGFPPPLRTRLRLEDADGRGPRDAR